MRFELDKRTGIVLCEIEGSFVLKLKFISRYVPSCVSSTGKFYFWISLPKS